jgi:hypothetical protein
MLDVRHFGDDAVTVLKFHIGAITNDESDYINLLVRIAHIICNHPLF